MFKEIKMENLTKLALSVVAIAALNGCGDDSSIEPVPSDVTIVNGDVYINEGTIYGDNTDTGTDPGTDPDEPVDDNFEIIPTPVVPDVSGLEIGLIDDQNLSGLYTEDVTLTNDKVWVLDGPVIFDNNATLNIEPGTVIAGIDSDTLLVMKPGTIINAPGTAAEPITFTSVEATLNGGTSAVGQWGGLTVIGKAGIPGETTNYEVPIFASYIDPGYGEFEDNSGILTHIQVLNSGATTSDQEAEINGLSLVGVGSNTTINNVRVDLSDDDGVEIWGGTVDLTDVVITRCTDDYFDVDEGYNGTVTGLKIDTTTGNAAVEMSGDSHPTFVDFDIRVGQYQVKEGGFYFKKAEISADLSGGRIIHYGTNAGAIHSLTTDVDTANTSFSNMTIIAPDGLDFTGDVADTLEGIFTGDSTNTLEHL